jgi:tRNA A-37 threonylcarbamoyl transferase component Bud32
MNARTYSTTTGRTGEYLVPSPWNYLLRGGWWVLFLTTAAIFLWGVAWQAVNLGDAPPGGLLVNLAAAEQFGLSPATIGGYILLLNFLSGLTYLSVSFLIFWRQPDHWWLVLVSVMLTGFGVALINTAPQVLSQELPWLKWVMMPLRTIGHVAFVYFIYTLPDGRFASRRLAIVGYCALIWFAFIHLLESDLIVGQEQLIPIWLLLPVSGLFYVAPMIIEPDQWQLWAKADNHSHQQQMKWIMVGLMTALAGFIVSSVTVLLSFLLAGDALSTLIVGMLGQLFVTLALIILPLAIGLAMMRYRLWEVDFYINRGLVYAILTVGLAIILIADLALLQQFFLLITGQEQSVIALVGAAAITGALFQPIHNRLRRWVDRQLFDIRIDYKLKPLAATAVDPQQTTLGPYQLGDLIGRGGMAEVYRAIHLDTERTVAIKLLRAEQANTGEFRIRFEREAQTVSALRHPNIIELLDFGVAEEDHARGAHYMVMEYIDGLNLSDYLRDKGRLSLDEATALLQDIAGALDYAHTQGIVHRDIKPSNVLLRPANGAGVQGVLTDFGIAKIRGVGTAITKTGMVGTLDYISPEQIREARDVDGRTDLYSLGVMAYQLLTGQLPFQASNPAAVLIAHLQQPPPHPRKFAPDLPETAVNALLQALAKEPEKRPSSAGAFVQALKI